METVILGEGITTLYSHAFIGCSSLKSINIPQSVISLPDYLFSGCSALTSITIPVGGVGLGTFEGCSSLAKITFLGTKEDWELVSDYGFDWAGDVATTSVECIDGVAKLV